MDFAKKQPAFLYLEKSGFYYFQPGLATVISMAFAENLVKDMDVLNGAAFIAQIKSFVEQYRLAPATITLILSSNVTFEKDIVNLTNEAQKDAVQNFVDTIPFESVLTKEYPIEKGIKVIGSNDDLYREIKSGFEKVSFSIECVVPFQLLGSDQMLMQNLTPENASQLLHKLDRYKQYNMVFQEKDKEKPPTPQAVGGSTVAKPKKISTRLIAMIGVFAVLFIVLGFMIFNMNR